MAGNISEQFNRIAAEYDAGRRRFIPCFDDFYAGATDFIASSISAPRLIVDLGAGTGILSAYWYAHFPDAAYVLVDTAEKMLDVARERFAGKNNVHFVVSDYSKNFDAIANDSAVASDSIQHADVVISALSIHHLENDDKARLFEHIHSALSSGKMFVNYDQFCAVNDRMNALFSAYWEAHIAQSGLSEQDIRRWQERRVLDRECSVESEVDMLRKSGFEDAQCVYQCQKFAVVAGWK